MTNSAFAPSHIPDYKGIPCPLDTSTPYVTIRRSEQGGFKTGTIVYPVGHDGKTPGTHSTKGYVTVTEVREIAGASGMKVGETIISAEELINRVGSQVGVVLDPNDALASLRSIIGDTVTIESLIEAHKKTFVPKGVIKMKTPVISTSELTHQSGIICPNIDKVEQVIRKIGGDRGMEASNAIIRELHASIEKDGIYSRSFTGRFDGFDNVTFAVKKVGEVFILDLTVGRERESGSTEKRIAEVLKLNRYSSSSTITCTLGEPSPSGWLVIDLENILGNAFTKEGIANLAINASLEDSLDITFSKNNGTPIKLGIYFSNRGYENVPLRIGNKLYLNTSKGKGPITLDISLRSTEPVTNNDEAEEFNSFVEFVQKSIESSI